MSTGVNRIDDAIDRFISKKLYDTHTQMPCIVTAVSLVGEIPKVDVSILWEGVSQENPSLNYKYSEILDVPINMLAVSPTIKITVPVKVGTLGEVHFPEKPLYGFNGKDKASIAMTSERSSHTLMGLSFTPSYFCGPIDADNIIIQNETSVITVKKDSIDIAAPTGMTINGLTITPDGDVVTKDGVSLNNVKAIYNSHNHGGGPIPTPQL